MRWDLSSETTTGCPPSSMFTPALSLGKTDTFGADTAQTSKSSNGAPPEPQGSQPKNSDIGGHHLAFYVDDLDAAIEYLRSEGVEVLGDIVVSKQGATGQRWIYFLTPWGMQCELVSYPHGKAYESESDVVMWNPTRPAE